MLIWSKKGPPSLANVTPDNRGRGLRGGTSPEPLQYVKSMDQPGESYQIWAFRKWVRDSVLIFLDYLPESFLTAMLLNFAKLTWK